jgi:hypothetical protein
MRFDVQSEMRLLTLQPEYPKYCTWLHPVNCCTEFTELHEFLHEFFLKTPFTDAQAKAGQKGWAFANFEIEQPGLLCNRPVNSMIVVDFAAATAITVLSVINLGRLNNLTQL